MVEGLAMMVAVAVMDAEIIMVLVIICSPATVDMTHESVRMRRWETCRRFE